MLGITPPPRTDPDTVNRVRVIIVGMYDSIHLCKWLENFAGKNVEFLVLPSSPHRRMHERLKTLVANPNSQVFVPKIFRNLGLYLWAIDKLLDNRARAWVLGIAMARWQPQYVHALEIQNAGYISLKALSGGSPDKPHLIVTNYGSDIFWFARQKSHEKKIRKLLEISNSYAAECHRDVTLARTLGFSGRVMAVRPNAGGFTSKELSSSLLPAIERRIIMVKGYHGWVGRAHIALQAIESISAELQDYEIVVYSCNLSTKWLATQVAKRTGLTITAYSKGALSHHEMLEKFSQALIYVGLSLSDGISTSMLEAMAMGAIPVQTSTACCDEWFSETGVAIETLTAEEVAQGIQRAIGLALTTDSAAKNREIIRARASREEIAKQSLTFYQL